MGLGFWGKHKEKVMFVTKRLTLTTQEVIGWEGHVRGKMDYDVFIIFIK